MLSGNASHPPDLTTFWAEEVWPQTELAFAFVILMSFASLVPLDLFLLHCIFLVLRKFVDPSTPTIRTPADHDQHF